MCPVKYSSEISGIQAVFHFKGERKYVTTKRVLQAMLKQIQQ